MTNMRCIYPDRDAVLVAYLYDDIDRGERVAFETHITTCLPCRSELAEMRAVRASLEPRAWWHQVPVWAQVAAAMLVLGLSASIANLDVRYGAGGLNVTTGWS